MKTISLKKVAVVAVASLGFGLMSVVPAQAAEQAWTSSLGTITPADGSSIVGSTITIPVKAVTVVSTAASEACFTATFTQKPVNTAKADTDLAANITNRASDWATAAAGSTQVVVGATANVLKATGGATAAAVTTASEIGAFTFSPDVPGLYIIDVTGADCGTGTPTFTNTATLGINLIVSGAQLTQATSGKGTATGTATTGGSAVVSYVMPGATAAAARFNITSSGVGSVTNPQDCADDSAVLVAAATAVRCTTGGSTTEGFINTINNSDGIQFTNTTLSAGNVLTAASAQTVVTFDAASSVAGVQTITVTGISLATGAPTTVATVTITWGASPVTSAALSTSFNCAGAVTTCAADATVLAAKTAKTSAADRAASIKVTVANSAGTSLAATQTITVTISGPGTLGLGTDAGAASAGRALTGTAGQNLISVFGDGTEGKATITISQGTTVIATETVSFYGAVAKVVATQALKNPLANGYLLGSAHATSGTTMTAAASWANASGNLPAVQLTVTDASGNLIPAQAANISAVSSDATVMSKTITAVEDTTATYGAGTYNVSVSSAAGSAAGKSATLTFRALLADGVTYVSSAAVTFTTGSSAISKVAITLDKTVYTAGDPAVMTVKATDAAGLAVADGLYASSTYAAPLFSKSVVAISTMPTTSTMATIGGIKDYKFYAPSVPGAFTVTGTYINDDAGLVPTTATSSITDGNAALMTQIDALNAKIVALNALIAKIMKKLGVK